MNNKNTIKTIGENEKKIAAFNGSSVRKWAEAVRKSGKLPKVYYYLATEPIRDENGTRVLVEGKWRIGCYIKGRPADFAQFVAGFGFKLPVSGTKERCKELFEEYRAAISQTGKYAPKEKKETKCAICADDRRMKCICPDGVDRDDDRSHTLHPLFVLRIRV